MPYHYLFPSFCFSSFCFFAIFFSSFLLLTKFLIFGLKWCWFKLLNNCCGTICVERRLNLVVLYLFLLLHYFSSIGLFIACSILTNHFQLILRFFFFGLYLAICFVILSYLYAVFIWLSFFYSLTHKISIKFGSYAFIFCLIFL